MSPFRCCQPMLAQGLIQLSREQTLRFSCCACPVGAPHAASLYGPQAREAVFALPCPHTDPSCFGSLTCLRAPSFSPGLCSALSAWCCLAVWGRCTGLESSWGLCSQPRGCTASPREKLQGFPELLFLWCTWVVLGGFHLFGREAVAIQMSLAAMQKKKISQ